MKTDEEIIKDARSSLIVLSTMLLGICNSLDIDADDTKMSVQSDEEVFLEMTVTEAVEAARDTAEALKKVMF